MEGSATTDWHRPEVPSGDSGLGLAPRIVALGRLVRTGTPRC